MFSALLFISNGAILIRAQEGRDIEFNCYTGFCQYCLNFHDCSLDNIWKNFDSPQEPLRTLEPLLEPMSLETKDSLMQSCHMLALLLK